MTLFFHPFLIESKIPAESVRLSRLDWWVLSDEWKLVRGFQFHIDPVTSGWEITEDGAANQSGESFNRMAMLGHPVATVLQKFMDDHDVCETAICMDADAAFAILVFEAQRAGLRAKTRITDRRSLKDYTDRVFDLRDGLKPLVEYFIKPDGHGFPQFDPITEI